MPRMTRTCSGSSTLNQATAGNGEKKAQIEGKGSLNIRITSVIFDLLKARGVDSHFVRRISETEQLVKKMDMYPLEIIMRNTAAGSFAKRYGVEEGTELKKPILEFCLKSDALGDPSSTRTASWPSAWPMRMRSRRSPVRPAPSTPPCWTSSPRSTSNSSISRSRRAKTSDGAILLADEITPDTCRLWDQKDHSGKIEHLDKDLFRRDLGNIIPRMRRSTTV